MCYVIGIKIPKKQTIKVGNSELSLDPINLPAQSGFTYDKWPVIYRTNTEVNSAEKLLKADLMHWELIPHWVQNEKQLLESRKKYTTLNIKAETILNNKVAQSTIQTNRCLVLASHFFEWQEIQKEKFPYCISVNERPIFYIAGVWNTWINQNTAEVKNSFGIITTEANSLMAKIHNSKKRMPTILEEDMAHAWMNENLNTAQIAEIAKYQLHDNKMSAYTVAKNFQQSENPCAKTEYKIFTPQTLF